MSAEDLIREEHRFTLNRWAKIDPVVGAEISAAPGCCSQCMALSGKRFTISDALGQMPLPVAGCTGAGPKEAPCRCCYVPVLEPRQ